MATREFGLFNDEGLVESGFYSLESAQKDLVERYTPEDELWVGEICPQCGEGEKSYCPKCNDEN